MKPEKLFRFGNVSAGVFVKDIQTEGGQRQLRSVSLQRRYRDGEEWKTSSSFGLAELPQAIAALRLAMDFVVNQEAELNGN